MNATDQKGNIMTAIAKGTRVHLTAGTKFRMDTGEIHADGPLQGLRRFESMVMDASVSRDVELTVTFVGCSHATMNDGGRDYTLVDENGVDIMVRTTLRRSESATFEVIA